MPRSPSTTGIATAWWVKPFLKVINAAHARPDEAARGARNSSTRVKGGETHRHLPGGPHHGHRRADEGLRRHGDDRRQGRRAGSCRCASMGPSARLSAICARRRSRRRCFRRHRHDPAAAQARGADPTLKGKARRQAAGAALQDIMVDSRGEDGAHRPDAVRGAGRGGKRRATRASRRSRIRSAASSPTAS